MNSEHKNELTRRDFLRTTTCTAAAAGIGGMAPQVLGKEKPKYPKPLLPAGRLGRINYPVTLISFGAILISGRQGSRLAKRCIDTGINLIHTSETYQGGKSIRAIGNLFKTDKKYRDKVFLCVKSYHPEDESEFDNLLKLLNTDYADVTLTTYMKPDIKRLESIQAMQDKLKKKGKLRHTGFVCHTDMNGVIQQILEKAPDYFDISLIAMRMASTPENPMSGKAKEKEQEFLKNLKALKEKGVGILAMKSGARTAVTKGAKVFQPHVKAILKAGADSILTSMNTFEQIEMVKGLELKSRITPAEEKAAAAFHNSRADACLMCGDCQKVCPQALPVCDLMRIRMYHEEYGWHEHARAEFETLGLDPKHLASICGDCLTCTEQCPINLAGSRAVQKVASLFT